MGGCVGVYGRYWANSCWDRSLRGVFVEREDFFVGGVELLSNGKISFVSMINLIDRGR